MSNEQSKMSRDAFLYSLPKRCLRCHREGVRYSDATLSRERQFRQLTLVGIMVAACTNVDCGARFAHRPSDLQDTDGFKCDGADVGFVDTLPYHISLGGSVSRILSAM